MKRLPLLHQTDVVVTDISLTTRSDMLGNILHCVEYPDNDTNTGKNHCFFKKLSSALDFIQTNFIE